MSLAFGDGKLDLSRNSHFKEESEGGHTMARQIEAMKGTFKGKARASRERTERFGWVGENYGCIG